MSHEFIKYDDPIFSVWRENYLSASVGRYYKPLTSIIWKI